MAAGSEASLAGSLLNDSPRAQEVCQTLRRFTKAQLRERGCSPSGSQFGENRSLPLGPSFADSRRAGAGGESDPCPLLIIEDLADKPAEVPTVDAVNMILFMEVRHSFAVPEIDGLMIVQGDVGHRFPFVVIESLFHAANLPLLAEAYRSYGHSRHTRAGGCPGKTSPTGFPPEFILNEVEGRE